MVAQVACIHAQGFGINFVPLHHIVAKAPCIARGTMLKPGDEPGFFSFGCTWIFLFLDIKKRPKLLKFGRFVYIFVYVLRKTLIFKVYCGETGSTDSHLSIISGKTCHATFEVVHDVGGVTLVQFG